MGSNLNMVRHALAIDDKRVDFTPTLWVPKDGIDLKQVWFSGVHTDVGGSYAPDKTTNTVASDTPLEWMIKQAKQAGLKFEPHITESLSDGSLEPLHKSHRHIFRLKKSLDRPLENKNVPLIIHESVKKRFDEDNSYRPAKLVELVNKLGWSEVTLEG